MSRHHLFSAARAMEIHPSTTRPIPFTCRAKLEGLCADMLSCRLQSTLVPIWPDGEILRDADVHVWRAARLIDETHTLTIVMEICSIADVEFYLAEGYDVRAYAEPHVLPLLDALADAPRPRPIKSENAPAVIWQPRRETWVAADGAAGRS